MQVLPLSISAVLRVALSMRAADAAEMFATRWSDDRGDLTAELCQISGVGAVLADGRGEPIVAIGAVEVWPTVWSMWMFATDRFGEVALGATRFARRRLMPDLLARGARRAECKSIAGHEAAHRWLGMLGAVEDPQPYLDFGKGGETFIGFVWRRRDVSERVQEPAQAEAGAGDAAA